MNKDQVSEKIESIDISKKPKNTREFVSHWIARQQKKPSSFLGWVLFVAVYFTLPTALSGLSMLANVVIQIYNIDRGSETGLVILQEELGLSYTFILSTWAIAGTYNLFVINFKWNAIAAFWGNVVYGILLIWLYLKGFVGPGWLLPASYIISQGLFSIVLIGLHSFIREFVAVYYEIIDKTKKQQIVLEIVMQNHLSSRNIKPKGK